MCIVIIVCPVCDVINFEINLSFFIKLFPTSNISRTKRVVNMKEKAFFIIFKGLSMKEIKKTFLEGESPTLKVK